MLERTPGIKLVVESEDTPKKDANELGIKAVKKELMPELQRSFETPEMRAERERAGQEGLKALEAALDLGPKPEEPAPAPTPVAPKTEAPKVAAAETPKVEVSHTDDPHDSWEMPEKPAVDDPHDSWDEDAFKKFDAKQKEDLEGWRQHFGVLAEIEEDKERMAKEAVSAAEEKVTTPQQPVVVKAPEAVPTPEEVEKEIAKLAAASKQQQVAVETRAENAGVLNTVKSVGEWYNKRPLWQKLMCSGSLLALGVPGASVGQKVLSGVGMFATLDALTKNKFKDKPYLRGVLVGGAAVAYALLASEMFKAIGVTQSLEELLRGWFGTPEAAASAPTPTVVEEVPPAETAPVVPVETSPLPRIVTLTAELPPAEAPTSAEAPAPAEPTSLEAFGEYASVGKGDSVWKLTEQKLISDPDFASLDRAQKDFVLDSYMKHLQSLGQNGLREFGISSGKLDVLRIGETLNFAQINDKSLFDSFLEKAENLSAAEKANILKARG